MASYYQFLQAPYQVKDAAQIITVSKSGQEGVSGYSKTSRQAPTQLIQILGISGGQVGFVMVLDKIKQESSVITSDGVDFIMETSIQEKPNL